MPELPEVETVRRGLAPVMAGATIRSVDLRRPDLRFPLPADFADRLSGARVNDLERRGKYLVAPLSTGDALIMHLGMTGRFSVAGEMAARPGRFAYAQGADSRHDHVVFRLKSAGGEAATIIYNDPRRFGFMDLAPWDEIDKSRHFKGMGPEPLSEAFSVEALKAALKARTTPIKAGLLDQGVVAGIGNIYACEALFRAGISPRRRASTIAGRRADRLHVAIVAVLSDAIEAGGSTLRDFAGADGALGYFQHSFEVYGREGEPCPVCAGPVRRITQSGRSTFFCGACQR